MPDEHAPAIDDLRDTRSWVAWVESQRESVKSILGLAAFSYTQETDTVSLIFSNSALRCMTESTCETIVELIRSFYAIRLKEWVAGRETLPPGEFPPKEATMPHLSIEVAPPFINSH